MFLSDALNTLPKAPTFFSLVCVCVWFFLFGFIGVYSRCVFPRNSHVATQRVFVLGVAVFTLPTMSHGVP